MTTTQELINRVLAETECTSGRLSHEFLLKIVKQLRELDKPDCIYTRCADDSATPNTLESDCEGAVLWYLGDDGDGEYPRFCHHCSGAVKGQA